ncbi:MAG: FAD-dependent oxidoreductase [Acetobacter sp.]|nr:FAD-dependent oxidoreductase [Acetobacter sp.]
MDIEKIKNELTRCLGCKVMPCAKACPLGVSPHDFIAAAKTGKYADAAALIAAKNPLPQTCGLVCPDLFCQKACIRNRIDSAIEIPCIQAEVIKKGGLPPLSLPQPNGKKAAIIGGGPAGLGALFKLITNGWHVDLFEKSNTLGGVARLIPEYRLPKTVLDTEIARLTTNNRVTIHLNSEITDFANLKTQYNGIILAIGEPNFRTLGIKGEEYCISYKEFLSNPEKYIASKIAICGGGEVALDCALTATAQGSKVEMFVRRRREDMRIMARDQKELDEKGVIVHALTSITAINEENNTCCLTTVNNEINTDGKAVHCSGTECELKGYDHVVQALGSYYPKENIPEDFILAGDMTGETGTVVQALASGIAAAHKLISLEQ